MRLVVRHSWGGDLLELSLVERRSVFLNKCSFLLVPSEREESSGDIFGRPPALHYCGGSYTVTSYKHPPAAACSGPDERASDVQAVN